MSFLVYDSVILGLIDRLTPFDTYRPPDAYAIETKTGRWCRQHAPPTGRLADPQEECRPRCYVCDKVLRGVMSDRAAKMELTLYSETEIDTQPATIYAIVLALVKAASWQEVIWLRTAIAVGQRLLASVASS